MEILKLNSLLRCPLNWTELLPERELAIWLNFAWYATACRHEVDGEMQSLISYADFTPSSYYLETLDAPEITKAIDNVRTWHAKAASEYLRVYQPLHRQRALGRDGLSKHYSIKARTQAEVVLDSATRGVSVLGPTLTQALQLQLLWATLDEVVYLQVGCNQLEAHVDPKPPAAALSRLFERHCLLIAANLNRPVGASHGKEATYLMFNVDMVKGHFHSYPILEAEYLEQEFRAHVQGWNFGLEA